MKKLIILVRMQLGTVLSFLKISGPKKEAGIRKKSSATLILIGALFLFLFLSVTYNFSYGYLLNLSGEIDLLPGVMLAAVSLVSLITSICKVNGTLFGFKDYDMVMSLPVKPVTVVISRLILFYILNLVFTLIVMLPCYVVYAIFAAPGPAYYICAVLLFPFLPMLPMTIAALLGTLIAVIAARFKRSNLVSLLLMILFSTALLVGSFLMQSEEQMVELGTMVNGLIRTWYPPAVWFLEGLCQGNLLSLALFVLVSAGVFFLFSFLTGAVFQSLNDRISSIRTHSRFVRGEQKQSSPVQALLRKEVKRFFSSTNYVMNCGIGVIMLTIGAVALAIYGREKLDLLLGFAEGVNLTQLMCFLICFCTEMVCTSACSLSLEGKSLWILKSSPIPARYIFRAKIYLNLLITIPFIVINGVIIAVSMKAGLLDTFFLLVLPLANSLLISVFDMRANIRFPMLDWKSEITVIKQSIATFIAIFVPMLFTLLALALYFLLPIPKEVTLLLISVIYAGAGVLLLHGIDKRAEQILLQL